MAEKIVPYVYRHVEAANASDTGRTSQLGPVAIEGLIVVSLTILVLIWLPFSEAANIVWLQLAGLRSIYSVIISLCGMLLGFGILAVFWSIILPTYRRRRGRPRLFVLSVFVSLIVLAGLNVWPISVYLNVLPSHGAFGLTSKVISLAFANGMMFFFFYLIFSGIQEESRKSYVISSVYRGDSESRTLFEYISWSVLSNAPSIFYYVFSFTLFSDLMFLDEAFYGILGSVFQEVLHEGWTERALFDLCVLLIFAMCIRLGFVLALTSWMNRRDLDVEART